MIHKKNKIPKKKKIVILVIILIFVGVGYLAAAASFALWPFHVETQTNEESHVNLEEASPEQKEAGNTAAEQHKNPDNSSDEAQGSAPSMEITSLNQTGNSLVIRTMIHTLEPGTCTLTLTHTSHAEISETADTQALASVSTCQGFDINRSELPPGEWQLHIEYRNEHTSSSINQVVNVE